MKNLVFSILNRTFLKPSKVKYCSQTIYEALSGCIRLYEFSRDIKWKKRSEKLCKILLKIQQKDGGFDIGYEFNFGLLHKVGESTSPELKSLMVLMQYYKSFPNENIEDSIHSAANWIKLNAIDLKDEGFAIPYAPYSTNEVMVYNGTSFAAAALGMYLSEFEDNYLYDVYVGMNKYLYNSMSFNNINKGKFWYYNDRNRTYLDSISYNKIDHYHQMQQVECHSLAELNCSSPFQKEIILDATEYIGEVQEKNGLISYYNISAPVHVWGFCSCASGFIFASKFYPTQENIYKGSAKKVISWILKYSWNGEYFYPILTEKGEVLDSKFYVRSDAWVFNALALCIKEKIVESDYINICEINYKKMENCNFSGIENHASNRRLRLVNKSLGNVVKFKKRWVK